MALPADRDPAFSSTISSNAVVGRFEQGLGAAVELVAEAAFGGGEQQALVGQARGRIDAEIEAGQMADRLGADADFAVGRDGHRQRVGAARADVADQHRGAAVDEALGQPFVQRVAEPGLDLARALGPFRRVRPASRSGGRYRPSCGSRRGGRRAPRCRPLTLSSRATSAANHSCGMCPPSPM